MSDLHGMEPVVFDFAAAADLKSKLEHTASQIEGQSGARASYVTTAMTDFKGYYSTVFRDNATTARVDAGALVNAFTTAAQYVGELVSAAREENRKRAIAREWQEQRDSRSGLHKLVNVGTDLITHNDDAPEIESSPPPHHPEVTAHVGQRRPLSGSGVSRGTSSARPEDLRSFARGSSTTNSVLDGRAVTLRFAQNAFTSGTQWGTFDASGAINALDRWSQQNDTDVKWARVVADAFVAAGGVGAVSPLPNASIHAALQSAGVRESRQSLRITMPSAIGHAPTSGYADDPVNTATGNFVETESDLEFSEAASALWWRRSYNSLNSGDASTVSGAFGPGWSSWCEAGLSFDDEGAVLTMPEGRQIHFARLGEAWDRASGEPLWLTREGDDLVVRDNAGARWTHTAAGRLVRVVVGDGDEVSLVRDGERLVGLQHSRGRSLEIEWDGDVVAAVRASDGRTVSYDYDDRGQLVAAGGPAGTRRYGWDDAGLIASVSDADGVVEVENTYDEHRRVSTQRSPHGRVSHYSYLPDLITVVADEDGTRANTWISDPQGRLVGVIDSHDQRQSTAYDSRGNVVMVTARDGGVTVRDHDHRDRLVREVAPSGADVVYTYDEHDRLSRVEVLGGDPGAGEDTVAVSTLEYDGEQRNPVTITDPEGGVTSMEWSDGLLRRVTDPTGVSSAFSYDAHGELIAATDAFGNTARLERDERGRVVASVTPSGSRTTFELETVTGRPTVRTDPDGSQWRFEHTPGGRLRSITDPMGARTEMEHDSAGMESSTIDPLGRALRRTYDEFGYLQGAVLPDGARWALDHDDLGRLTSVTDPGGGTVSTEFGPTGAPTAVTDASGVRREIHEAAHGPARALEIMDGPDVSSATGVAVDRLGRLVSETGPDGSTRLTRYDRCGRPVEIVDPAGGVTRLQRDAAGRVTTVVKPSGGEIGYAYDAAGRLETVVDETGAVVTHVYDADSRVVSRLLPTGDATQTRYDVCGRVVALRVPGVGTTTFEYDPAGRVTQTHDGRNGRRRFRYDPAGQLVAVTDGNGATTAYGYDTNGRCVEITRPDGGVTRREYNATNRVVAETDPLGRRTTAEYDAAGRQVAQTGPDGSRVEWCFDPQGLLASTWVDGVEQSSVERDLRSRTVRVTDRSGPGGAVAVHELVYDERGLLVSRTRDGRGPSWTYDADGACSSLTSANGVRTTYSRDGVGRLVGVSHPLLGETVIERDAGGRIVTATAGGVRQDWGYSEGFLTAHQVVGGSRTDIDRDGDGCIRSVTTGDRVTRYAYDDARQLVAAATSGEDGERVLRWRYDTTGRLVAESVDGVTRELTYDVAGQLARSTVGGEDVTTYSYDAVGRRVGEAYADGSTRAFSWSTSGWLRSITRTDGRGASRRTDVVVDALGELARVDTSETFLDTAGPWGGPLTVGERDVVRGGPVTGVAAGGGGTFAEPRWRDARAVGEDPWTTPPGGSSSVPGAAPGLELMPDGTLVLGDLEWMGSRVYDPATRAFLSVDPVEASPGAGWAGNPYSYAGNDPLHALDPLGLHPLSDHDLQEVNANNGAMGALKSVGHFIAKNKDWIVGGLLTVGGVALMFAPFPGAANIGMGLASAGVDTLIQKATTGHVNYKEVLVSGALGMLPGAGEGLAAKVGMSGWKAAAAGGAIDGAWQGGLSGGVGYLTDEGPHTVNGFLSHSGTGALWGTGTGAGLGTIAHGAALHKLGDVDPTPVHPQAPTHGLDPYAGVKDASRYLQDQGVPREFRKQALESFSPGTIKLETADAHTFGLRHYGGEAQAQGRYLTPTLPANRSELALPPQNTMEHLAQFQVPEGTKYVSGGVGPNFGHPGGGHQMYVHDPSVLQRVQ